MKSEINVIVIGPYKTGKTTLVQAAAGLNQKTTEPTLGVDCFPITLKVEGKEVNLMVWDTAGQQAHVAITKAYFKRAHAAVLVYQTGSRETFDQLINFWLPLFQAQTQSGLPVVIVGCKSDLGGQQVWDENRIGPLTGFLGHFSTSVKDPQSALSVFQTIAKQLYSKHEPAKPPRSAAIPLSQATNSRSNYCN